MKAVVFDEAHKWSHWFYPWLIGGVARLFAGFLLLRYARRLWEGWFAWLVFVIIWSAGGWRVSETSRDSACLGLRQLLGDRWHGGELPSDATSGTYP